MRVLLTNDDGIYAQGLRALSRQFSKCAEVTVVAPDRERSAIGHAITLAHPLRMTRVPLDGAVDGFAVTGTPADCIKLAILEILAIRPDLVISGINPGINVGINLNYSGTVAGAREAALNGIPAVSVSVQRHCPDQYQDAAVFIERLAEQIFLNGLPYGTFLNVNMPDCPARQVAGIQMSRQGISLLSEYVERRIDPRDRTYFWQGCDMQAFSDNPDIDGDALCRHFISITPVKCDTTDYDTLEQLKSWNLSPNDLGGSR